jgi:uncharacterized protein YdgA (DUF945 family)
LSKKLAIASIIVFVIVLAYPAASWVTGFFVESQNEATEQKALAEAPYVTRTRHDYRRGVFTAVETSTYQLTFPTAKGAAAAAKLPLGPWHLTTHCLVRHGPLPGLRTLALATADCALELPAEVSGNIAEALRGKAPFEAHTRMDFSGGSTVTYSSPAFTLKLESGATVNWQGITGTAQMSSGFTKWSGSLTSPGLTVDEAATHTEIGAMTFTADMRRVYDILDIGTMSAKLAGVSVHADDPDKTVEIKGVSLSGLSTQNGDYVDWGADLAADSFQVKQVSISRIGYAFKLEHAHGPSLAAFVRAMRDLQRQGVAGDPQALQGKLGQSLREHGIDVLTHDPVFEIPHFGFTMPEGEARLSAKVSAPGLTREELQGPALQAALIKHLEAEADLAIDAPLLERILSGNKNAASLQQQLAMMQKQGYVTQSGSKYTTHLSYQHGRIIVNGLPFPPQSAPPRTR